MHIAFATAMDAVKSFRGYAVIALLKTHKKNPFSSLILATCALLMSALSHAGDVQVFAAASLTDALTELSDQYQAIHPNVTIKKSFAGSSALAKQIENGAPAQIFLSADKDWADYLQQRNLLQADTRKNLLGNQLVLITPVGKEITVASDPKFNLASAFIGKFCTGNVESVPVGKYTKQAFTNLGWWDAIVPRLVGTEDVRTTLAFVERGECALGAVYRTDAKLSQKVTAVAELPADSHPPIIYPGSLVKGADAEAADFWKFLQSPNAAAVYERYGFSVLK